MGSRGVSRAALPSRKRHIAGALAGGALLPQEPLASLTEGTGVPGQGTGDAAIVTRVADLSSQAAFPPQLGIPLNCTIRCASGFSHGFPELHRRPTQPNQTGAPGSRNIFPWAGASCLHHNIHPPAALHEKRHQTIYSRCQLQAPAEEQVYLRYHVDCYTSS